MKTIRIGRATCDELHNTLSGMAASPPDDPAHERGLSALQAIKTSGRGYVFQSDDSRALAALQTACETVIVIDGYGPDEALLMGTIKRSCRRILRELTATTRKENT